MRVLFVTPECAPFAKAGGLGDVGAALPAALRGIGVDARVLLPAYAGVEEQAGTTREVERFSALGYDCRVLEAGPLLLLDCPPLYRRGGTPYQDEAGQDWPDNPLRFGLLCQAAARLPADVLHCNDWPTALTPLFTETPTLLTIHNLAFQGNFDRGWLDRLELGQEYFSIDKAEFHGRMSFLKAGMVYADALSTVSPTYAREIQTDEFGCGLQGLLRHRRESLEGILNGIDTAEWNPATDAYLARKYDAPEKKAANKTALQKRLGLEVRDDLPLFGFIGRLTHQKGIDLIAAAAEEIAALPAQLVVLGRGERELEGAASAMALRHPGRFATVLGFSEELAHQIQAGVDALLMPSRYEPCGLNQMYSQRYGTPPVARATGGLADTVLDGVSGFLFERADPVELAAALRRAAAAWRDAARWRGIQLAGMRRDFSWPAAARRYAALYSRLATRRSQPARSPGSTDGATRESAPAARRRTRPGSASGG